MNAFDRFTRNKIGATLLTFSDGDYLAVAATIGLPWSWVVWFKGTAMEGRCDMDMDAARACEEAVEAIGRFKAAERRPNFVEEI